MANERGAALIILLILVVLGVVTGAGSRNRTGTLLPARDFESRASTNFAIPAGEANWRARL